MTTPKTISLVLSTALLGSLLTALNAQIVYSNDFSTTPTIIDAGTNTSPFITSAVNPSDGNFIESNFNGLSVSGGALDFSAAGGTGWLYLDTSSWSAGDYEVTFDGQVSSGTMNWDVFGGNNTGSGTGIRIWMNDDYPAIRKVNSGLVERLGQVNAQGDTAGTATEKDVAAGSFSNTTLASQSLNITLTGSHTGSTGDFVMIGWAGAPATIDNLSVAVVPEPATYAFLFGLAGLGLAILRRRRKARL